MSSLTLIKLGGSLITDKTRREAVEDETLARLAAELAAIHRSGRHRLVLGHGSGSYGHFAAQGTEVSALGLVEGGCRPAAGSTPARIRQAAVIQHAAARLHRRVIEALLDAGASPFSLPPSAIASVRGGCLELRVGELLAGLDRGFLPVVYGDVVLDDRCGASICSTEPLFVNLARQLVSVDRQVERVIWLGATAGVLDASGAVVPRIDQSNIDSVRKAAGGARGVDVTGGMALRVEAAWRLARSGVPSTIVDGGCPGTLARALDDEPALVATRVIAAT